MPRVLVILVFTDNQVQNRIVQLAKPLDARELEQAANYLNSHLPACAWTTSAPTCWRELRDDRQRTEPRCWPARWSWRRSIFAPQAGDRRCAGQRPDQPDGRYSELADLDRLRELFEAFQQKNDLLQLMEVLRARAGRAAVHRRGIRLRRAGRLAAWSRASYGAQASACWARSA